MIKYNGQTTLSSLDTLKLYICSIMLQVSNLFTHSKVIMIAKFHLVPLIVSIADGTEKQIMKNPNHSTSHWNVPELAHTNETTRAINTALVAQLPGEPVEYQSLDSVYT